MSQMKVVDANYLEGITVDGSWDFISVVTVSCQEYDPQTGKLLQKDQQKILIQKTKDEIVNEQSKKILSLQDKICELNKQIIELNKQIKDNSNLSEINKIKEQVTSLLKDVVNKNVVIEDLSKTNLIMVGEITKLKEDLKKYKDKEEANLKYIQTNNAARPLELD